jgi:predicted cupin superfamily sugar epimerase
VSRRYKEYVDIRAAQLITMLDLRPHPEGGYYREVFRSAAFVQPLDPRPPRLALTTIYFLLAEGEVSRWHRVASDEAWHFHEGDPLELFMLDPQRQQLSRHLLGAVGKDSRPVHVVPGGVWQAARTTGAYTLVGCTVGPGFDFADFHMLRDVPADVARWRAYLGAAAAYL